MLKKLSSTLFKEDRRVSKSIKNIDYFLSTVVIALKLWQVNIKIRKEPRNTFLRSYFFYIVAVLDHLISHLVISRPRGDVSAIWRPRTGFHAIVMRSDQ